jgi:hypothetical protein
MPIKAIYGGIPYSQRPKHSNLFHIELPLASFFPSPEKKKKKVTNILAQESSDTE